MIILDRVGECRVSSEWLEQDKKLVRDHSNWSLEELGRELHLEVQLSFYIYETYYIISTVYKFVCKMRGCVFEDGSRRIPFLFL